METNNKNKFIVVSYALYDVTKGDNGEEMLIERTTDERPIHLHQRHGRYPASFRREGESTWLRVKSSTSSWTQSRLMVSTMMSAYWSSTSRFLPSTASLMHSTYR